MKVPAEHRSTAVSYDTPDGMMSKTLGELDDEAVYANEQMISDFHDTILKGLKGSLQLKVYKDESISFRYNYCSETTGKQYLEFTFTPEDYN